MEDDMACFDGQEIFSIKSTILFWHVICKCKICLSTFPNFDEKTKTGIHIFNIELLKEYHSTQNSMKNSMPLTLL